MKNTEPSGQRKPHAWVAPDPLPRGARWIGDLRGDLNLISEKTLETGRLGGRLNMAQLEYDDWGTCMYLMRLSLLDIGSKTA